MKKCTECDKFKDDRCHENFRENTDTICMLRVLVWNVNFIAANLMKNREMSKRVETYLGGASYAQSNSRVVQWQAIWYSDSDSLDYCA